MRKQRYYRTSFLAKRSEKKAKRKLLLTLFIGGILIYLLLTWILPTLIGGLSVLNQFKTQPKKEIPVSENLTLAPPVLNIPFEATNSSTIIIKGYATPSSKVEIYLDREFIESTQAKEDGSFILENISLSIGTNSIYGQTIDEKGNKSLPSKPITITYDNEKPSLTLKEPSDNQTFKEERRITITGTTDSQGSVSVTINGNKAIVDSNGNFSQILEINEGENDIIVVAADPSGNNTKISRKVIFEPQ